MSVRSPSIMTELDYRYQSDDTSVAIEDKEGGSSVYARADEILIHITAQTGSLRGKHIFWLGMDGFWNLLLPEAPREGKYMAVYSLGGRSLAEAKTHLAHLIGEGIIPGIIS